MMKKILLPVLFAILGISFVFVSAPALAEEEKILHVYAWSEYLPQDCLDRFEAEYGIKVIYSTYDSNEAMYAKLKLLDGKGYDLMSDEPTHTGRGMNALIIDNGGT